MSRVYIGLILLGLLFIAVKGYSREATAAVPGSAGFTVSGEILYDGVAPVTVVLVDEDTFGRKLDGLYFLVLDPAGIGAVVTGRLPFEFSGLPPGIYALRCFADENGNGELDGGAFGPTESWGMSWQSGAKQGIPKFRDISFTVDRDVSIDIVVH